MRRTKKCSCCGCELLENAAERAARESIGVTLCGTTFPDLPATELCRDCRLQRRYAFRNDWNFYRRACDRCQKTIVSIYSPDKAYPVFCPTCFWSDDWSALDYGVDYDFSKGFFEQYYALQQRVPRISIFNTFSENSDYSVHSTRNKNCYLVASVHESDSLLYSDLCRSGRDCVDMYSSDRMELCYECVFCLSCYDSEYLRHCIEVSCSTLCFDCRQSSELVGCVGQRGKKNLVLNQPATAAECQQIRQLLLSDPEFAGEFRQRYQQLLQEHVFPAQWQINCEDCVGNHIRNSKAAVDCFNVRFLEDCFGIDDSSKSRDCVNSAQISSSELLYECHATAEASRSAFSHLIYNCSEMFYCDNCQAGCNNCFGSISLTREEYCILNKRYTQAAYAEMTAKIAAQMKQNGEWGQFFPVEVSPFGYQETKAAAWYPMPRQEVLGRGWKWSDYEPPPAETSRVVAASDLPSPATLQRGECEPFAIACEVTGRPFRLVSYEIEFYVKKGLPLPRRSPWQRHAERVQLRLRPQKAITSCAICGKETVAYLDAAELGGVQPPVACLECSSRLTYGDS